MTRSTTSQTAFTETEREAFGLAGLLPPGVDTDETQVRRVMQQLDAKPTDLERFIYLDVGLLDTDVTLFYRVVMSDPARFLPILYDPHRGRGVPEVRPRLPPPPRHVPLRGPLGGARCGYAASNQTCSASTYQVRGGSSRPMTCSSEERAPRC